MDPKDTRWLCVLLGWTSAPFWGRALYVRLYGDKPLPLKADQLKLQL